MHRPLRENLSHKFLLTALRGMERLRNVVINFSHDDALPFWVLDAILSMPQLDSVRFGTSICLPGEQDRSIPKHLRLTGPAAPLTSFRRPLPSHAMCLRIPAEADLLHCLFKQLHRTLQVVEIPSHTAPLRAFRSNDWIYLRELVLRGGPRRSSCAYMAENLTRMPNLRILKLELAQSKRAGPQYIFPPGWTGGCPWPKLEVLLVANPHPDDELYDHLPSSLEELTLRCFPRYYTVNGPKTHDVYNMERNHWAVSLLTSTEMLRLLRRCGGSLVRLQYLDMEFAASSEDAPLLRHVAAAFPSLTFLQFWRYHTDVERNDAASWVSTP